MNQSSWTKESISKALKAVEDLIVKTTDEDYRVLDKVLGEATDIEVHFVLKLINKAQRNVLIDRRDNANAHHHMHQS